MNINFIGVGAIGLPMALQIKKAGHKVTGIDVAEAVVLYDLQSVTKEAVQLAELGLMSAERLRHAVKLMSNWDNARAILQTCEEIDRLESDADRVMRSAMSKLFREEADVREVIKLKAIYELLETITDKCEDVANQIEGIVLENS